MGSSTVAGPFLGTAVLNQIGTMRASACSPPPSGNNSALGDRNMVLGKAETIPLGPTWIKLGGLHAWKRYSWQDLQLSSAPDETIFRHDPGQTVTRLLALCCSKINKKSLLMTNGLSQSPSFSKQWDAVGTTTSWVGSLWRGNNLETWVIFIVFCFIYSLKSRTQMKVRE